MECKRTKYTTPLKKNMRIYCNPTSCDYLLRSSSFEKEREKATRLACVKKDADIIAQGRWTTLINMRCVASLSTILLFLTLYS